MMRCSICISRPNWAGKRCCFFISRRSLSLSLPQQQQKTLPTLRGSVFCAGIGLVVVVGPPPLLSSSCL